MEDLDARIERQMDLLENSILTPEETKAIKEKIEFLQKQKLMANH